MTGLLVIYFVDTAGHLHAATILMAI